MFGRLPMYQQRGKEAYTAKLDNILAFSSYLKDPHKNFKCIHVGGTNGKGSSSHMLASVLQEAGYKVGLYTSPHLKDFRERIKINGETASKSYVVNFVESHHEFLVSQQLSFFEMTVGMAFHYFASEKVDIAIIEVGLGGRLDSTNIIVPEVSLITNIGWDHTDLLGDSLEKITREKAGIIKKNVPVVISEYQEGPAKIFKEVAVRMESDIYFGEKEVLQEYKTSLLGSYQSKNVKGVITALKVLPDFQISEEHIKCGLENVVKNTGLLGRWQILQDSPKIVCDTAHNKEGVAIVVEQLLSETYEKLHIVLGFAKEKNIDAMLPLFPKHAIYYLARPNIRRGLDGEELLVKAQSFGLASELFDSIPMAFEIAKSKASSRDLIFVGGSTFTVAEIL